MDVRVTSGKGLLVKSALPFLLPALLAAQNGTISVDVNLVELYVTARDSKGNFVPGLSKEDFRVFENGQLQTVRLFQHEDAPVSVGLIVDGSGSMRRKRRDVTQAALAFVRSSNPQDEMFVVNFSERAALGLPADQPFTADAVALERAINSTPAAGRTALYDAIHLGLAHLDGANRERKVLIVISDGGDNVSRRSLPQVMAELERSLVPVYTIGLFDESATDQDPGILKRIAQLTGGEMFLPSEPAQVVPVCEQIAKDIRSEYILGYAPSNSSLDSSYRKIRVTASNPQAGKVIIRTREGYVASPKKESKVER